VVLLPPQTALFGEGAALEPGEVILVVESDPERTDLATGVAEELLEAVGLGRVLGLGFLVGNGGEESVFLKDQLVEVAVTVLGEGEGVDIDNETQLNDAI
jgi:hypothetical protein